jgi:hypothetical protein
MQCRSLLGAFGLALIFSVAVGRTFAMSAFEALQTRFSNFEDFGFLTPERTWLPALGWRFCASSAADRWSAGWRPAVMRGLLISICDLDELRLPPSASQ